jgi:aspartyl/glutamyl-tRNA(Asn/Gln) amidotransferase C subunit
MIERDLIQHLGDLARIQVSDEEADELQHEFQSILYYVATVQQADEDNAAEQISTAAGVENVMREDTDPHEPGRYTEELLDASAQRQGQYVAVKKIISRS